MKLLASALAGLLALGALLPAYAMPIKQSDGFDIRTGKVGMRTDKVELRSVGGTAFLTVKAADSLTTSYTVTMPDPGANASIMLTGLAQSSSAVQTLTGANVISHANTGLKVLDTGGDHLITIAPSSNEAAARTVSLPALGGAATFGLLEVAGTWSAAQTYAGSMLKLGGAGAGVATFLYANDADSRSYTVPDAGASASVALLTAGQAVAGTLTRADLTEEALVVDTIPLHDVKELTGLQLAATASANKFGLSQTGSFTSPTGNKLVAEDCNNTTKTDACTASSKVPLSFIAGQSMNVQITVAMTGAGAAVAAPNSNIDVKVYRIAGDGSVSTDLCTTAAQALAASATVRTFACDTTSVVPGDVLIIWVQMVGIEGAAASAIGEIDKIAVAYDTKG